MNRKFLQLILCFGFIFLMNRVSAQQTLSVRINSSFDDMEEWIAGPPTQTKPVGDIDWNSSDLEFGYESSTQDPQLVGLRFTNISIPKGSIILKAYIQFTVDAVSKNADPCNVVIRYEPVSNASPLDSAKFNLTIRSKSSDSVYWSVGGTGWNTVGTAGPDQRTPDLKNLIQNLINTGGWNSGNAMTFFLKGTGTREVESFDGDAAKAPLLVIEYVAASSLSSRISAPFDDIEEWLPGANQTKTVGDIDWNSSDIEFGTESSGSDPQLVGLRFTNINIPKNSMILNAYIQFTVDATSKNSDPCKVVVKYEPNDNPSTFDSVKYHLTNRTKSSDSVLWTVSGSTWGTVGNATADQRTPDLKLLVQQIVSRNGWNKGNAMAFFLSGTGTREVESFDGDAPKAAQLVIEYIPLTSYTKRIDNAFDDLEEWLVDANQTKTAGEIDWNSSDLEFGYESGTKDPQLVGLRFTNLDVPKNAIVKNAYIQFTVDATSKNADPCNVVIRYEPSVNATPLDSNDFHLTKRTQSSDSVYWTVGGTGWNTVGSATPDQRTPNLTSLIEKIVSQDGWNKGNAMTFFLKGTGTREVESFDGDAPKAPMLVIEYLGGTSSGGSNPNFAPVAMTNFPVTNQQNWYFWDKKNAPANTWKDTTNNDTLWKSGKAPLGYGDIFWATKTDTSLQTAWFRKPVNIADMSLLSDTLELNLICDDGAIVYVNGTEVLRRNMPTGAVDSSTLATRSVEGTHEMIKFSFDIPKTAFRLGKNIVAVEVHNHQSKADLGFDIEIKNRSMKPIAAYFGCNGSNENYISCFPSLVPTEKVDSTGIPTNHNFQSIFAQGDAYSVGGGIAKGSNDFTGFIPKNGSSTEGWLSINHETSPGGVSMLDIHLDCQTGLWVVDSSRAVDFATDIVLTASNCSGGITPWGTVVTCEETTSGGDANADGYNDLGWNIEINPVTKKVMQYGTGKSQKLWAMGRMSHENACFSNDSITSYYGEDAGNGSVYKYVANKKADLSAGTVYVLKLDSTLVAGEPKGTNGIWVQVPNTTQAERNNLKNAALGLGASTFSGVEDVEIGPIDGKIYFTAKGLNRTYRFKDEGSKVSEFETYVGGRAYRINTSEGVVSEDWGGGNDNLTFDSKGNLYVLQDGSRDHIWLVKHGHTQAEPKVEIFMTTPKESEPTGMTFTPDNKFMFMSIQGPSPANTTVQYDAAGKPVVFNKATTIVIGLDSAFSRGPKASYTVNDATQCLTGNNFELTSNATNADNKWSLGDNTQANGKTVKKTYSNNGNYSIKLTAKGTNNSCLDSTAGSLTVYAKPSAITLSGNATTQNGSTVNYSATQKTGSTYNWSITNGTQTTGGNTSSIAVKWNGTGTTGIVKAVEMDANNCAGDTARLNITLTPTGSISRDEISGLKLYPNPVLNALTIESEEDVIMTLLDTKGRVVLKVEKSAGEIKTIDLSSLEAGSYFVQLISGDKTFISHLLKINQ